MAFCKLNKCLCLEVRSGSLVIGYIILLTHIARLALVIYGFIKGAMMQFDDDETNNQSGKRVLGMSALGIVLVPLYIYYTYTFVMGVHMYERRPVGKFLVFSVFYMTVTILGIFGYFNDYSYYLDLWVVVLDIMLCVAWLYFILVIASHYSDLVKNGSPLDDDSSRPITTAA